MMESKPTKLGAELGANLSSTTSKLWTLGKSWAISYLYFCLSLPMGNEFPDGTSRSLFIIIPPVLTAMPCLAWRGCLVESNEWIYGQLCL